MDSWPITISILLLILAMMATELSEMSQGAGHGNEADLFDEEWLPEETALDPKACQLIGLWEDVTDDVCPEITVDKARKRAWDQGKRECALFCRKTEEKVQKLSRTKATTCSSVDFVFFKLFGYHDSRIGALMKERLGLDEGHYHDFMTTFFTSCFFGKSVKTLRKSNSVQIDSLMGLKSYDDIWRRIDDNSGFHTPFWSDAEEVVNKDLKDLFLCDSGDESFNFLIALDDDKMHFAISESTALHGLKAQRHVRDNRKGLTAHTSAMAAMDVPLRIDFERERDTTSTCFARQIKTLFGGNGGDGIPNLSNVTLASDRGYWNQSLLFDFVVDSGAHVIGTVARSPWFPFTYDRKEEVNKPMPIKSKGLKTAFYKKLLYRKLPGKSNGLANERALTAVAFRNGSGNNVSLAMSTSCPAHWWDFCLAYPSDSVWYFDKNLSQDDRNLKAFRLEIHDNEAYKQKSDVRDITKNVEPRTVSQLGQDWFVDRMFSLTSSTVDKAIRCAAPFLDPESDIYESFLRVLTYTGTQRLLQPPPPPPHDDGDELSTDSYSDEENSSSGVNNPDTQFIEDVKACQEPASENVDIMTQLEAMSFDQLQRVLSLLGLFKQTFRTVTKRRSVLKEWIRCEPAKRPYLHKTSAQLRDLCRQARISVPSGATKATIEAMLLENDLQNANIDPVDREQVNKKNLKLAIVTSIIRASFLKRQSGSKRDDTRKGRSLEGPFIRELWRHGRGCNDLNDRLPNAPLFDRIYSTGLVRKIDAPFVKDSSDAVGVMEYDTDNAQPEIIPIEIKARLAPNTIAKESSLLRDNVGLVDYEEGKMVYEEIADSDVVKWIPNDHESFQLLHHVYCYAAKRGMFLVGDDKKLMLGILVHFDEELLSAYDKVVHFIYENGLAWAYDSLGASSSFPTDIMEEAIEDPSLSSYNLSVRDVKYLHALWWTLNVKEPNKISFPLPKCVSLLPFQQSFWNNVKGGSDTLTKLIDFGQEKLGIRTVNNCATARCLLLHVTAFLRSYQMLTAGKELDDYPTLSHFRNAASHRLGMEGAIELIIQNFQRCISSNWRSPWSESDESTKSLSSMLPKVTQKRSARNKALPESKENWLPTNTDACTPTRGRKPNKNTLGAIAHRCRAAQCNGLVLVSRIKDPDKSHGKFAPLRGECALCGMQTPYYCMGCKRYLCFDRERKEKLSKRYPSGIPDVTNPLSNYFDIEQIKTKRETSETKKEHYFGVRSCYHIAHEAVMDRELQDKSTKQVHWKKAREIKAEAIIRSEESY